MGDLILDSFLVPALAIGALVVVVALQKRASSTSHVRAITRRFTAFAVAAGILLLVYSLVRDATDHTTWGLDWILGAVMCTICICAALLSRLSGVFIAKSKPSDAPPDT